MPTYSFRCSGCGDFDVARTLRDLAPTEDCPRCGTVSRRVYTAPALRAVPRALVRARDREDASRHEPALVRRPTAAPGPQRPVRAAPGHPPLPRP